MKNYYAKSILAIGISILLFASCKKDVPSFDGVLKNESNVIKISNVDPKNTVLMMRPKPIFFPDSVIRK
ncbi:MAG: hypothetical protein ABIN97_14965 [Ginsengibacter sp.]